MKKEYLIAAVILAVAFARLVPHPYNFTPIGAFALFCGAYIADRRFLVLPLLAVFIGDLFTGLYTFTVMIAVYAGFAASTMISRQVLFDRISPVRFLCALLLAAVAFYLISNIGMWWHAYPHTLTALVTCWLDGLPFLLRSLTGDFVYGCIMFGIVEALRLKQLPNARAISQ